VALKPIISAACWRWRLGVTTKAILFTVRFYYLSQAARRGRGDGRAMRLTLLGLYFWRSDDRPERRIKIVTAMATLGCCTSYFLVAYRAVLAKEHEMKPKTHEHKRGYENKNFYRDTPLNVDRNFRIVHQSGNQEQKYRGAHQRETGGNSRNRHIAPPYLRETYDRDGKSGTMELRKRILTSKSGVRYGDK
jgi:hypothetical protein